MKHILIVEDDLDIGDILEESLKKENYKTSRAYSGTEAILFLKSTTPDLILLDLMLPGISGEEIISKINNIPIIVLSAKTDTTDKVNALLSGACDFVTKPFNVDELLARITVALRNKSETTDILTFDEIKINIFSNQVYINDTEIKLTKTEFVILKKIMQNPSQIVTKSLILDEICDFSPNCTEDSLKIHISNLRKKLREINGKDYIESVWGIGFKLKN